MVRKIIQRFYNLLIQISIAMKIIIKIENVGGIFYINGKRLGQEPLSEFEQVALNEFIKEYKQK
ncbi:hypothetical protein CHRY9293_02790 [Chryseobacterium potabilaquae]|uniref:Uncharacterized protein n=1 Tax=Chryseobacterium potabilaquae TaxID=2675057 RepID=A0A6N4X6X2_9FLAO|nr:hypothetical protein CHRY9293_02790 [Chryseobacterium potabilaquae]